MSWIHRLRSLFEKQKLEDQLDEELQFHIEMRTQEFIATGMTPEEARHRATRLFGNRLLLKEKTREMDTIGWIETLWQDLRYALRMWRKNPGFTAVAVLSLALGIGANTAIFSVLDEVLLRSLPVRNPAELALLTLAASDKKTDANVGGAMLLEVFGGEAPLSYPLYRALGDSNEVFSGLSAGFKAMTVEMAVRGRTGAVSSPNVQAELVSGNYFSVLGVEPMLGRVLEAGDDRVPGSGGAQGPVVVLSYRFWRRHFALDPAVLGRSIRLNGSRFTVV